MTTPAEVPVSIPPGPLSNADLAPTPASGRTWNQWHFASLWIAMSVCIPTYMLAASLINAGLNWWQSLAAEDFDRDGDVDLVAGNVGLNYPYRPTAVAPFELFVADFDGDGDEESVPAYHEAAQLYPWYGRTRLGSIVEGVLDRFPTWDAYARQTLGGLLGEKLDAGRRFAVTTLATTYLENTGNGRFAVHALPPAAQVSAVAGIVPADFDGDGALDLVIAGNLHDLDPSVPRLDGGVGLFLRGDGSGGFTPMPPWRSGLWLEGDVRRLAPLRMRAPDRPALLAGVVGAEARLIRTERAR